MAKRKAERKAPDELTAAKARIADLEALEAERSRAVLVQAALYRIAEAASAADDLPAFYRTIHEIVGELMYAENMYIALYDDERGLMNYPYYVDAFDVDVPDPNAWEAFGVGQATGVTAYALRRGEPLLIDGAEYQRLRDAGQIELLGVTSIESTGSAPRCARRGACSAFWWSSRTRPSTPTRKQTSTCSPSSASTSPPR